MIQDTVKCTLSAAVTGKTYKYCIYLCGPGGEEKMNRKMGADTRKITSIHTCVFLCTSRKWLHRPHWYVTGIFTSALGSFISMGFFFDKKISVGIQMSKNSLLMMFLWALVK